MKYVDQSADALQFSLIKGTVNKSMLNILCDDQLIIPGILTINIGIIGASHYLEVVGANNKPVLTEVLACVDINSIQKVISCKASDIYEASITFDGIHYALKKQTLVGTAAKRKMEDIERLGKEFGHTMLKYTFPNQGEYNFTPTTIIAASKVLMYDRVAVRTIHAYPNEDKVVSTLTLITKNKEKKE